MAKTKKNLGDVSFAFFDYIQHFLKNESNRVYQAFDPLTRKYLNFNNPKKRTNAFLRLPQFEALEVYAFLKEFCQNKKLWEIFEEWYEKKGVFEGRSTAGFTTEGQGQLFDITETGSELTKQTFQVVFNEIKKQEQVYPNYIFALTMGLGKTIFMATCIFYEFLLAKKYPKDERFCHNVLVFAPDITVLNSLREIQTFDKSKVVPQEYISRLDSEIKFHFLNESGGSLNIIDGSNYNIIISNTQKIILKKQHKPKSAMESLFNDSEQSKYKALSVMSQWANLGKEAGFDTAEQIENDMDLQANQRFQKLLRLKNLGIFVDEAHHVFGNKLAEDLTSTDKATSLRVTINEIAEQLKRANTKLVACYNFTGTPYVKNKLLAEVVYSYGLSKAIENKYLKEADVYSYTNVREDSLAFVRAAITDFWSKHEGKRYENMLPKIAFYASSIEELQTELRPAIEQVLIELGIDTNRILVNVGDASITSNDDIREFLHLDTPESEKQFILLVNKGKEGWNCRSLFAVALHREPKSKIFVLQATMRCLRQITSTQQTGLVYLSEECYTILDNELRENFCMSIPQMKGNGLEKETAEVRIVKPVKITLKRPHKMFRCNERKVLKEKIDFCTSDIDLSDYSITRIQHKIDDMDKKISTSDVSSFKTNHKYSTYTLVAEIARYINISPLRVQSLLLNSVDGIEAILEKVNAENKVLYDKIIPRLFEELYEIEEFTDIEEVELELVKDPSENGSDHYTLIYKSELIASMDAPEYSRYKDKSFNVDNYIFDSIPEKEMFWALLHDRLIDKVWFTGMFTRGQSEFYINYIDPITKGVRTYFPDFVTENVDGTFTIVEVKGEDKIDDKVVLAKKEYAEAIASTSGMKYIMVPSKEAKCGIKH